MKKTLFLIILLVLCGANNGVCRDSLRSTLNLHGQQDEEQSDLLKEFRDAWTEVQNVTGPLTIEGDVLGYAQSYGSAKIDDDTKNGNSYGAYKGRIRLHWSPIKDGEFFFQVQGGASDLYSNPSRRGMVVSPLIHRHQGPAPAGKPPFLMCSIPSISRIKRYFSRSAGPTRNRSWTETALPETGALNS